MSAYDAPSEYPFLVIDTRTDTVAAVYTEEARADATAEAMNEGFPGRYIVVQMEDDRP